ncbi:MAG TPA: acyltransferase [Reyranella sp.]|nr:acyltransferase [Reyranella sp.]
MDQSAVTATAFSRPQRKSSTAGNKGFLTRIESVRGLAALSVALTHARGFLLLIDQHVVLLDRSSLRDFILDVFDGFFNGETAVILFFAISGVVIGRALDARQSGLISFLIRRIFRLYPAHIVATLAIVGLGWLFLTGAPALDFTAYPGMGALHAAWLNGESFNPLKLRSVAGTLTMAGWSLNLVIWSLYAEMCAAPLLPLFHNLSRRGSVWLDAGVLALLIGLSLLNWDHLWSRYLFVFYLGMMVETRGLLLAGAIERALGGSWAALGFFYLLTVLPNTFAATRPPLVILLEAIGAFGLISVVVRSEGRPALASLEHPLLRWNGRLSYSFYLWHYFVLTLAVRGLYASLPPETMQHFQMPLFVAVVVVTVAIALAVAQISYSYIELPFMKLGRMVLGGWHRKHPARPKAMAAPATVRRSWPGRAEHQNAGS